MENVRVHIIFSTGQDSTDKKSQKKRKKHFRLQLSNHSIISSSHNTAF